MILILSDRNDSHAKFVIEKLIARELPYYSLFLDVDSLKKTVATFENGSWSICQEDHTIDLSQIKCVWNRRTFVELLLDEEYDQSTDFKIWKNEWNKTLLGLYSSLRKLPWLNPWRNAYKAENKYFQMEKAKLCSLNIPNTIVSNNKDRLLAFTAKFKSVALKLMHQDFYKNDQGEYKGLYVNKITEKEIGDFGSSGENPIVLQEYIEKKYEVRYTVVGKKHFVCKIDSQRSKIANTDWRRYDIPHTPHSIILPPIEIEANVNRLMEELQIEYGALDFIVDQSEKWLFLEVNSMGQFLWIEDLTGLKISDEIINWLKNKLY